jgi:hypothetical protein
MGLSGRRDERESLGPEEVSISPSALSRRAVEIPGKVRTPTRAPKRAAASKSRTTA